MANIREKYGLNRGNAIAILVCMILMIAYFVISIIQISRFILMGKSAIIQIISLIIMVCLGYYAFWGYKKPHGNLLRDLFFIYAVLSALIFALNTSTIPVSISLIRLIRIVLIAFMAGRLNKYRQNLVIASIIMVLTIINSIYSWSRFNFSFNIYTLFGSFGMLLYWITMSLTYITRYKLHKEAGLEDKQ